MSFEVIVDSILNGGFRGVMSYRGTKKIHQGQKILLVEIDNEIWKVPHTIEDEFIFLRTAYPAE